jgi:hypothetical protein
MMETTGFELDLFGRWEVVVRDWRNKNSTSSPTRKNQQQQERRELIDNIVGTLEDQKKATSVAISEESGEKSNSGENNEAEVVEDRAAEDKFTLVERKEKRKNPNKPAELSMEQILSAVAAGRLGVGKPGRPRKLTAKKTQPPKKKNLPKASSLAAKEKQSENDEEPSENK